MARYTYRGKIYTNKEDWKAAQSGSKTPSQTSSRGTKTSNKSNASGGTYTPNSNKTPAGTNVYSGKTSSELNNERKYLNNLISQGGGTAEWAKSQLNVLNTVTPSDKPSSKPAQTSNNNSNNNSNRNNNKKTPSGTNVYSGKTASELDNERKYLNNLISQGGGTAEWAKDQLNVLNTVTPSSTPSNTSGSFYDPDAELTIDQYLNKYLGNNKVQEIDKVLGQYGVQPQPEKEIDYEEQYRKEQLKAMEEQQAYIREQQRIANQMAVNSGVERLQNQLKTTNQGFDEAGRQAYIQATQAEYALPNQLSAMGYTGGLSETEAARSRANYQNQMANIEQQRVNAQNEVYAAINNLRNTADQRTAEQNAELAREYANRLMELELEGKKYAEQKEAQDLTNWQNIAGDLYYNDYTAEIQRLQADNADGKNDAKIAYLMAMRQQKLNNMAESEAEQAELDRKAQQQEYENAVALAKLGVFEPLQSLGYDVSNLQRQWNADLQKTIKSGSGTPKTVKSGSGTGKKETDRNKVFNAAFELKNVDGLDDDAVTRYVWGQGLSEEDEINVLTALGLLNNVGGTNPTNNISGVAPINIRDFAVPLNLPTTQSNTLLDNPLLKGTKDYNDFLANSYKKILGI